MAGLRPTTPEGTAKVADVLMPAIALLPESGASAKDLYVVLRALVDALEPLITTAEGPGVLEGLRYLARKQAELVRAWRAEGLP